MSDTDRRLMPIVEAMAKRRAREDHARDAAAKSIRIIPHEESIEVRYPDDRPSCYFYFDDNPGRRSINGRMTRDQAVEEARSLARASRDKSEGKA